MMRRSENEYGLTFEEWLAAAGYDKRTHKNPQILIPLVGAWRDGQDPTDYRHALGVDGREEG